MPALKPYRDGSPRIPRKVRLACDALVSGRAKTQEDAANQAGLTREHFNRSLNKPHVLLHMETRARRTLALAVGRAATVAVDLLDASSEHVRLGAVQFILGLQGIVPLDGVDDGGDKPLSEMSLAEIESKIRDLQARIAQSRVIEAPAIDVTPDPEHT